MKITLPLLAMTAALFAVGCTGLHDDEDTSKLVVDSDGVAHPAGRKSEHEEDQPIPLADVPEVVKQAALAAVPGLVLEEATVEEEDGELVYDLEGKVGGKEYELEVSATGKVNEIEEEGADEDDGSSIDEDDDDDDHEGDDDDEEGEEEDDD